LFLSTDRRCRAGSRGTTVGTKYHIGVENGEQGIEVTIPRRREKRIYNLSFGCWIWAGFVVARTSDPATAAARKLTCGLGALLEYCRNLGEWHSEKVVQDKGYALSR
jgi:hypothetical protein